MQEYYEDDSIPLDNHISIDLNNDSAHQNWRQSDKYPQAKKLTHLRQIEILQENKKLLSSIKDIYDY